MQVLEFDEIKPGQISQTALTIGAFDGVHLGHREIFRSLLVAAKQKKLAPLAITFQPLPREVFGKPQGALAILSFEERKRRIEACGIELLAVIRFTKELGKVSADDFMDEARSKLDPKLMVIGHDFRFGKDKAAGEDWIREYCGDHGIELKVVSAVVKDGEAVSSSRIRSLLKAGELEKVTGLLDAPYQLEGKVVSGRHRGKTMGFATANLVWKKELLIPTGIYAAWAGFDHERRPAAVNIGFSPTFGEKQLGIEAHLLGYEGQLYGRKLRIALVKRLRGEIKFGSVAALVEQIGKDVAATKKILGVK